MHTNDTLRVSSSNQVNAISYPQCRVSKWFLIFQLVLITAVGYSQNITEKKTTKYFRKLVFRESPFAPIKGAYPINAELSRHCLHFKIDYDELERPVSVEYRRGENLFPIDMPNRVLFNYFIRSPKTQISYTDSSEIRRFFDINDQPTEVNGFVFEEEYRIENGKRVSLRFYSKTGVAVENDWGIHQYLWSEDSKERIKETRLNLDNEQVRIRPEFEFYEVRMEYDSLGFIKRLYNYGLEGSLTENSTGVAYDELTYNENGDFTGWQVFNANSEPVVGNHPMVHRGEHTYNAHGDPIMYRSYDVKGNLMNGAENAHVNKRIYNDKGDLLQSRYYQLSSDELIESDRPSIIDLGINEKGYVSEITLLGAHGEWLDSPRPPKMTREYLPDGSIEQVVFWDADGTPLDIYDHYYEGGQISHIERKASPDSTLYIQRRTYDQYNRPISYRYYTKEGEPTEGRGMHEIRYDYDKNWRQTERRFSLDGSEIQD